MNLPPLVEKYAVLDALEEAREETLDEFVRGVISPDKALGVLVALHQVTARVNALPVHLDLTAPLVGGRQIGNDVT